MASNSNGRIRTLNVALYLSAIAGALTAPASAANQTGEARLEEIVVTAQRREQSLEETPVSVTAISGEELAERGVQNANDLVGIIPGFSVRDNAMSIQFNLRGYISTDPRATSDSPVAVYIDDVFLSGTVLQQLQGLDIARVEALRGPQGTLFGRNATGGLVHFISNQPTDQLTASVGLQLGQYDERIVDAAVGGPLTDQIAGRIAVKYNYNGGWQENLLGGKNRDSKDALGGRGQLRFKFAPDVVANFSFQANRERNQYQGYSSFGVLNAAATSTCSYEQIRALQCYLGGAPGSNLPPGTRSLATYEPDKIYSKLESDPDHFDGYLAIARVDWSAGENLTISSISSLADGSRSFIEDDNASGIPSNDSFNLLGHAFGEHQFSQEFRAAGASASGWQYVAGVYYLKSRQEQTFTLLDNSAVSPIFEILPETTLKTDSIAAFTQVEVPFTDLLRGIFGARVTHEKKTLERISHPGFGVLGPAQTLPESSGTDTVPTGKIGLQWILNKDLNVYGHVSTGFKSAEPPPDKTNAPLNFVSPEKIRAFEVGLKSQFLDGRARLNLAAFVNKIYDKQSTTSILDPVSGAQAPDFINFGDVKQKGAELEFTARPIDSLQLAATVAYVDNSIEPKAGVSVQRQPFFDSYTLNGNELPGAPPTQLTASAEWTLPLAMSGALALGVDWRWQSRLYWNISNNKVEMEPSYDVGDVRLNYTSGDKHWFLSAFVKNVTNTPNANVNFNFGGSDALTVQWGRPRWYGARAAYAF